ncbi:hypothetical protein H5410_006996 [Solanum commersonii]|uniref:Uncharacterized protein n=1 Tax=Solanum commersonii TaxID=4109 RepID=A0A9J6AC75_SOLCO|nr:hypothetical protein H5410_006996 [Solanum commersonii]
MVDHNTEKRNGLNFARLLIEVEMGAQLPDEVKFKNEKGKVIEQPVQYDWKPTLCRYCKKYGHTRVDKKAVEVIWEAKQLKSLGMVNLLSWNVRGLNSPNKQKEVKLLCNEERDGSTLPTWKIIIMVGYGLLGDLITTKYRSSVRQLNRLHVRYCTYLFKLYCKISYVYAFNSREERKELWESLLIQNFNSILKADDRIGGNPVSWSEIVDFNECVIDYGLLEVPTQGNRYTWSDKHDGNRIFSKID